MKSKSLRYAIVGAGFAGLALAFKLAQKGEKVHLYHKDPVGSGASAVASGLLHPFPAQGAKLSYLGYKALHLSLSLLDQIQSYSNQPIYKGEGIVKLAQEDEEKRLYAKIGSQVDRLEFWNIDKVKKGVNPALSYPALLIKNGYTVFCKTYLEALKKGCEAKGVCFFQQKIDLLEDLKDYDYLLLCAGSGIKDFELKEKLKFVKGQILTMEFPFQLTKKSLIAQGYITITDREGVYHVGSTYEHHYKTQTPDLEVAKKLILDPFTQLIPEITKGKVIDVSAGVRVMNPKNYIPYIKKCSDHVFAVVALGSRGLLYHALLAEALSKKITNNNQIDEYQDFFK